MLKTSAQPGYNRCMSWRKSSGLLSTDSHINNLNLVIPVYLAIFIRYLSVSFAQLYTQRFTVSLPLFEHYLYSLSTAPTIYITNLKKESI